jgi:hypothetical protein
MAVERNYDEVNSFIDPRAISFCEIPSFTVLVAVIPLKFSSRFLD